MQNLKKNVSSNIDDMTTLVRPIVPAPPQTFEGETFTIFATLRMLYI